MIRFPYPRNHPVYTTWPGNTAAIFEPSVASMSIPFRNVFVPNRGLTCGPYSATTRPSAGQESRPRSAANPVPVGASPGDGRAGRLGGGTFATARRCFSCRSRMKASSRRVASESSPTIRSW